MFHIQLSHSSVIILITGIGDNDDICPSDFVVDGPLGNLQECIITSGKLLLEVYYWCRLRSITLTQIHRLPDVFESALYQLQRLYAYKCWFRGMYSLNDRGIKMHGVLHLVFEMCRTGSLENSNTRIYENKHIEVAKDPFRQGSKRTRFMAEELFERNEKKRLLRVLVSRFNEVNGPSHDVPIADEPDRQSTSWIIYTTPPPNVVTYKCSRYRTNSERVTYDETAKKLVYTNLRNINPMLRVDVMWHEFEQHEGLQGFLKHFKRNDKGIGKVT